MASKSSLILTGIGRIRQLQEMEKYENSLLDFSTYIWPVVEPAIPFVKGWVIEAICEHLEACAYGQIRRLLINVPPGFTKSLLTDVFFPAWIWGPQNKPHTRFLCAAYSEHLTVRDNMRCRSIIISDRYQRLWKDRFKVATDQFTKIKFANDKTGWKLATSVGGIGTGERADFVIVDDPNNPMEMESEVVRQSTKMWFTEVLPDRLNNQALSAIIVIQQRTHEEDVSGIAIAREMGYTHLMVPMFHDTGRHCVTVLGYDEKGEEVTWEDPRTEEDELAWPERFSFNIVKELERDKGEYAFASQYQQIPMPRGGSIIKSDYWQAWKEKSFPGLEYILASLDTAYTIKDENDCSALTIWGVFRDGVDEIADSSDILWSPRNGQTRPYIPGRPKIILMEAWQERLQFHDLIEKVIESCIPGHSPIGRSFPVDKLLIESKANGISVAQELYRMFSQTGKIGIELINPTKYGDKWARVNAIQHLFCDKMIYAPVDPDDPRYFRKWADMVINQCAIFPRGARDDLVDSMSMAMRYLRDSGFALQRQEQAMDNRENLLYRGSASRLPLYPV